MPSEIKSIGQRLYSLQRLTGSLDINHRPVTVIQWSPGQAARVWDLMLSNDKHCLYFEQHDLRTHQTRNLVLVTPSFLEAAKRSKLKFEIIEEVE